MFLDNQVLGVEMGWNVTDTDDCGKVVKSVNVTRQTNHIFLLAFAFARSSRYVARAFLDVEYIASGKLDNLSGVCMILHVEFAYAL